MVFLVLISYCNSILRYRDPPSLSLPPQQKKRIVLGGGGRGDDVCIFEHGKGIFSTGWVCLYGGTAHTCTVTVVVVGGDGWVDGGRGRGRGGVRYSFLPGGGGGVEKNLRVSSHDALSLSPSSSFAVMARG